MANVSRVGTNSLREVTSAYVFEGATKDLLLPIESRQMTSLLEATSKQYVDINFFLPFMINGNIRLNEF